MVIRCCSTLKYILNFALIKTEKEIILSDEKDLILCLGVLKNVM